MAAEEGGPRGIGGGGGHRVVLKEGGVAPAEVENLPKRANTCNRTSG